MAGMCLLRACREARAESRRGPWLLEAIWVDQRGFLE